MDNTQRFLDALERHDVDAAVELLAPDVTWRTPMSMDGSQRTGVTSGREDVEARLRQLDAWFDQVRFADRRTSRAEGATTTFVQANGDFVTKDGRPYRNVYVFRFDWRGGQLATWEEYANPVTVRLLEQGHG